ncbi:MAG: hypothetical protein P8009_00085 [Gammaproteobacteria bacterium]
METTRQTSPIAAAPDVLRCGQADRAALAALADRYGAVLSWIEPDAAIPGSFWGACEAGLVGNTLYVRRDTPVHSALHELCHYICMDGARRAGLHTDAGGDYEEENGVCFLQILLADALPGVGRERMLGDMDAWGYSFRLGSARAWFESDAEDARDWLLAHDLIDAELRPTGRLRRD